jgi:hypothetical protein
MREEDSTSEVAGTNGVWCKHTTTEDLEFVLREVGNATAIS